MSDARLRLQRAFAATREHAVNLRSQISEQAPLLDPEADPQAKLHGSLWAYPVEAVRLAWLTLTSHFTNVLTVFVPIGIAAGAVGVNPTAVFILNFLAIVPLASLLSFATEELAAVVGPTVGGLLNASFGNAVELIVSIIALRQGKIRIVQASMIGSVLSNTLLILGCCFLAGGVHRSESRFNQTVASTISSLMLVASASLVIPATLYGVVSRHMDNLEDKIEVLSRGTSIILLCLYALYLYFQLHSHALMFSGSANPREEEQEDEDEAGPRILRPKPAVIMLLIITALIALCAEFLVDSIDAIVSSGAVSETFVGLIILPIVSNAAEHVTAVIVSYKGQMDLAMIVALGSGIQIPLLVTPLLVLLGWIIGQPMTLRFEIFETIVFFLTILVMNNLIHDGRSNYLEGAMCLGTYLIIALAFFVYPENDLVPPLQRPDPSFAMVR